MFWEYLKKTLSIINRRLINVKASSVAPVHSHVRRKTVIAAIFILTLITLITVVEDFSVVKSVVRADSITAIGVGIYWDNTCTNITHSLNWGIIDPDSNNNLTIYVRNELNSDVSLWLTAANWNPSNASNYLSLSWNYSSQILKPNEVIPIKLTLTVSPTIFDITNFSLETVITTSEQ